MPKEAIDHVIDHCCRERMSRLLSGEHNMNISLRCQGEPGGLLVRDLLDLEFALSCPDAIRIIVKEHNEIRPRDDSANKSDAECTLQTEPYRIHDHVQNAPIVDDSDQPDSGSPISPPAADPEVESVICEPEELTAPR